jgi:hypothetical protein
MCLLALQRHSNMAGLPCLAATWQQDGMELCYLLMHAAAWQGTLLTSLGDANNNSSGSCHIRLCVFHFVLQEK